MALRLLVKPSFMVTSITELHEKRTSFVLSVFKTCDFLNQRRNLKKREMSIAKSVSFSEHVSSRSRSKIPFPVPGNIPKIDQQFWASAPKEVDRNDPVQISKAIFFQSLKNVIPAKLITSQVTVEDSILKLEDHNHQTSDVDLRRYNKKYIVGFGKAVLPMAESLYLLMGGQVDRCIVSVPAGFRCTYVNQIEVYRGAQDNIPDEDSFEASKAILELVRSCSPNDLLIVLISGGGSALLPYPIPPVTLEEKKELILYLSKAGSTIHELNTVRKRLSMMKGGGLVQMCKASKIISLIISDVAGNQLDIIASGPTVQNLDQPNAAYNIIEKYNLDDNLPTSITQVLTKPAEPPNPQIFQKVKNFIIGDNRLALEAAAEAAISYDLRPYIITTEMSGEASDVGYDMAATAEAIASCINNDLKENQSLDPTFLDTINRIFKKNKWPTQGILPQILKEHKCSTRGVCLLFGGETTVKVRGCGTGGRNQELVLSAGIRLDLSRNLPHVDKKVAILSGGTDGFDGPNCAAGAVVNTSVINDAQLDGYSPMKYLRENNSFNFFHSVDSGKYHILCGHTETNVMDMSIIVILKKGAVKMPGKVKAKSTL